MKTLKISALALSFLVAGSLVAVIEDEHSLVCSIKGLLTQHNSDEDVATPAEKAELANVLAAVKVCQENDNYDDLRNIKNILYTQMNFTGITNILNKNQLAAAWAKANTFGKINIAIKNNPRKSAVLTLVTIAGLGGFVYNKYIAKKTKSVETDEDEITVEEVELILE